MSQGADIPQQHKTEPSSSEQLASLSHPGKKEKSTDSSPQASLGAQTFPKDLQLQQARSALATLVTERAREKERAPKKELKVDPEADISANYHDRETILGKFVYFMTGLPQRAIKLIARLLGLAKTPEEEEEQMRPKSKLSIEREAEEEEEERRQELKAAIAKAKAAKAKTIHREF